MNEKIKDTEKYNRLFTKYGGNRDPIKFLSKWEDWAQYRRWEELDGSRFTSEKRSPE